MTRTGKHWSRRRSRWVAALAAVLCCVVVNVPPAQAEPSHGNGIKAAGKDAADAAHLAAVAEVDFDVVTDGLRTLLPAYAPIVHR